MLALALALAAGGCGKERPVEAPVIDVVVGAVDGGMRPLSVPRAPPSGPPGDSRDGRMVGTWTGVGRQDDGQEWELHVRIDSTEPGLCAHADYPTVPCAAEWLCEEVKDGVVHVHERLLQDSALRCVDNGKMTMRIGSDGLLDWRWTGQGQTATAKLRRN